METQKKLIVITVIVIGGPSTFLLKGLLSALYGFKAATEKGQNIKKHPCRAAKHRFFPTFFPLFYSCNGQKTCKSPLFHYFLLHMQHI